MIKRIIKALGLFKHEYKEIGTGNVYSQKSAFYECKKCGTTMYVPLGMQEMLIARGCTKKRLRHSSIWHPTPGP